MSQVCDFLCANGGRDEYSAYALYRDSQLSTIPKSIAKKIEYLDVSGVLLEGQLGELQQFTSVRHLLMSMTNAGDRDIVNLENLSTIETLACAFSLVSDAGLHVLEKLPSLRRLFIGGTRTGAGMLRAPNLESLHANMSIFSNKSFGRLSLRSFSGTRCVLAQEALDQLLAMPCLSSMSLYGCNQDGFAISRILESSEIESITFGLSYLNESEMIKSIKKRSKPLKHLNVYSTNVSQSKILLDKNYVLSAVMEIPPPPPAAKEENTDALQVRSLSRDRPISKIEQIDY